MDKFLRIVEEEPSVEIEENTLRRILSHIKVWDFVGISQLDYQSLPATERYSILNEYYVKMLEMYGTGIKLICFYCLCSLFGFLFGYCLSLIFC